MKRFSNKLAISTPSLGMHPSHNLDRKIQAAAQHGFEGLEIVYGDLKTYSDQHNLSMSTGAESIRRMCDDYNLFVIALAPFENFEGSISPLRDRLTIAAHWIDIARILRAKYLQVPSQYDRNCIGDESVIVSELQQLADMASAAAPVVAIAYEPMSWGIHYPTWELALRLAQLVDRGNFGICLDSFHIITRMWASPFEPSGQYPNATQDLADSLHRSVTHLPIDKLFYVQLSDGERFDPPFSKTHPWYVEGEAPEFTWSKHARPFPLESDMGGYMPVAETAQAWLVDKGFKGWVSLEVFDRRMRDESFKPEAAASRGQKSWDRLQALQPGSARL